MYYRLKKNYTHHGGTTVKLSEIKEGTLLFLDVNAKRGFEYITVSYGDDSVYYLSSDIVERNSSYFEQINEEEFESIVAKIEFKNEVKIHINKGLTYEDAMNCIEEAFDEDWEEIIPEPNDALIEAVDRFNRNLEETYDYDKLAKRLLEKLDELEKAKHIQQPYVQPFINSQPINPYNNTCPCGNTGSQPCFSVACPKRLIVTYCGTTQDPNGGWVRTTTSQIKPDNNDK
jgi:hypothetical protein